MSYRLNHHVQILLKSFSEHQHVIKKLSGGRIGYGSIFYYLKNYQDYLSSNEEIFAYISYVYVRVSGLDKFPGHKQGDQQFCGLYHPEEHYDDEYKIINLIEKMLGALSWRINSYNSYRMLTCRFVYNFFQTYKKNYNDNYKYIKQNLNKNFLMI